MLLCADFKIKCTAYVPIWKPLVNRLNMYLYVLMHTVNLVDYVIIETYIVFILHNSYVIFTDVMPLSFGY